MFAIFGAIFGSTGFGTVIGLIGSYFTRRDERKKEEIHLANEQAMAKLRVEELKLEQNHELAMADKQIERAEVERATTIDKGELEAFKASLSIGSQKSGKGWVNGFNSLMRPLITLFLLGVTVWFASEVFEKVGGLESLDSTELQELFKHLIMTFTFLASTAVTWWFGARPTSVKK